MNSTPNPQATRILALMATLCILAVGLALVAQHHFNMRPCPWCILQRGLYLLLAACLAIAAFIQSPGLRRSLGGLCTTLSAAGIASAAYQHLVAKEQFSCKLSLADKIISALKLDTAVPAIFSATANCTEAAVSVLGIPFAFWSLALFTALGLGCAYVLFKP